MKLMKRESFSVTVVGWTCPVKHTLSPIIPGGGVRNSSVFSAPLLHTHHLSRNSGSSLKKKISWSPETLQAFFRKERFIVCQVAFMGEKNKKQKGVDSWAAESRWSRSHNDRVCRNYILWKCYKRARRMCSVFD